MSDINNTNDFGMVRKAFLEAVMDVIGTMAGIEAEKETGELSFKKGITGAMTLVGGRNALVSISMPMDAAGLLVSYMTGIYASELSEEDICDGIAELANMVCGRAKIVLADTAFRFSLTSPFVIVGENHYFVHKKNVGIVSEKFRLGDTYIGLELTFP